MVLVPNYCIVLYGCSLLPNGLFKVYCVPPNLGITRTWICRLNFAQRPNFSGLRFFNEPEISDSGPPASSPSRRTCTQDFFVLKKSIDLSLIWTREPWTSRRARYPETTEANLEAYKRMDAEILPKTMDTNLLFDSRTIRSSNRLTDPNIKETCPSQSSRFNHPD